MKTLLLPPLPCDVARAVMRSLNGDDGWRSFQSDRLLTADERARSNRERKRADDLRSEVVALGSFSAALVAAHQTQCGGSAT